MRRIAFPLVAAMAFAFTACSNDPPPPDVPATDTAAPATAPMAPPPGSTPMDDRMPPPTDPAMPPTDPTQPPTDPMTTPPVDGTGDAESRPDTPPTMTNT